MSIEKLTLKICLQEFNVKQLKEVYNTTVKLHNNGCATPLLKKELISEILDFTQDYDWYYEMYEICRDVDSRDNIVLTKGYDSKSIRQHHATV